MLAHLHVVGCPCSRCRVARNYARLLAAFADGTVTDPSEPVAAERRIVLPYPERRDGDAVPHEAYAATG